VWKFQWVWKNFGGITVKKKMHSLLRSESKKKENKEIITMHKRLKTKYRKYVFKLVLKFLVFKLKINGFMIKNCKNWQIKK